jgi:hypothetical protein
VAFAVDNKTLAAVKHALVVQVRRSERGKKSQNQNL